MAVIQKIRDKYAKLAGFVIALALIGFIISDGASGGLNGLFGPGTDVVTVNGSGVDQNVYAKRINDYESIYELYGGGRSLDEATKAQIRDQVLRELISEKLIDDEFEKLGIEISKTEENDIIKGNNIDPMIQQFPYFMNPETRSFDVNALNAFESRQIDMSNPNAQKALYEWEVVKEFVKRNHRLQKFNNLVVNSVYYPSFITVQQQKDQHKFASVSYVKIPYASVSDEDPALKVTDQDLQQYMKKRAAQYTIEEPVRSIEYVTFEVLPSSDDTAVLMQEFENIRSGFSESSDMEIFVGRNSDEPYTGAFYSRRALPFRFADTLMSLSEGSVYGPYFDNNAYKMTKVVSRQVLPDSVKCRHILVRTEQQGQAVLSDEEAKRKIDSISSELRSGVDFMLLAIQHSDDDGSRNTGGEYDFTLDQRPNISKEFADFIFEGKAGQNKIVKVSNSNYSGYHYIEIISQSRPESVLQLATVVKTLLPGQQTNQEIFAQASEFAGKNTTGKAFDEAVEKQALNKKLATNIKVNDFVIEGIGPSREIIRWIYESKKDEVSGIFNLDSRFIVARVSDVQEKGLMKLDQSNRPAIEAAVKNEKKAVLIRDKHKNVNSLESLAQSAGQTVQKLDSFSAAGTYLPGLGYEPKVVGYAFFPDFKEKAVSAPLRGQEGVFYLTLDSRWENEATVDSMLIRQQQQMMGMQIRNTIGSNLLDILRRDAEIKYNGKILY